MALYLMRSSRARRGECHRYVPPSLRTRASHLWSGADGDPLRARTREARLVSCTALRLICYRTRRRASAGYPFSAGLDYPGAGPEHAFLKDSGRASYEPINNDEALAAFQKCGRRRASSRPWNLPMRG